MYFDALKMNIVNSCLELHEEPELIDVGRETENEGGRGVVHVCVCVGGREYREYVTK